MDQELEVLFRKAREDFPLLKTTMHGKPLVYLDSAATAQKPQCMIDAVSEFYASKYGTVHRAIYELAVESTHRFQEVRETVRKFLNAEKAEEIIYTRGTTESINLVAYSFGKAFFQPGDEVIISQIEHHSNIVPWQILCEDRGAVLKVIPANEKGELDLSAYRNMLTKKTKLVAVTHISNSLGTINPVKEMAAWAHQAGAKILIDGAQSAPHFPIDVRELDCDFFVFSGHKVYGPTGIGILYGKASLLDAMPPYQGGGDMIDTVTFEKTTYNTLPLKFEAGTPMIAEVIGLGASIDYLQKIGLDKICRWEQELLEYATAKLQEVPGIRMIGTAKNKGAILSFLVEGIHPLDLGTLLDLQGVAIRTGHLCAQPVMQHFGISAIARISLGLYTMPEEIDTFIEALKQSIPLLQ